MTSFATAPPPPPPPSLGTALSYLARAVGRFETLLVLGLGVTVLSLILDAARAWGYPSPTFQAYGVTWGFAVTSVVAGAATAAIVVLVLLGLYYALSGLIAWRRGVWALRRSARELPGGPAADHLGSSLREERRTVIDFLVTLGAAILVGIAIGIADVALLATGQAVLPGAVASLLVGLIAGAFVVLVYYHGTRHLMEVLAAADPSAVSPAVRVGQEYVILGAALGCLGSVSSVYWPMELVSVLGLALVLYGFLRLKEPFDAIAGRAQGGPGGASRGTATHA